MVNMAEYIMWNDLHAEWPCGLLLSKTRLGKALPTEGKSETIRRGSKPQHRETCTNMVNVTILQDYNIVLTAHPTNPVEGCADANPKTMLPNDT